MDEKLEKLLDVVERLLEDAQSTTDTLPPHESMIVSGDIIEELTEVFELFLE